MHAKDNNGEKIDLNFSEIIKILNKYKIKYWICHGTLLGIIRDKQLIPWDLDIDIAVWSGTISKEKMTEIMLSNNFRLKEKHLIGTNLLSFTKQGGRVVDINFYEITTEKNSNKKIAFINFYIPKNFFYKLIEALSMAKTYNGKLKHLIRFFSIFELFFNKLKIFLINKNLFYRSAGYTQPLELLKEFKNIIFYDINVTIPTSAMFITKFVYRRSWKSNRYNIKHYFKDSIFIYYNGDFRTTKERNIRTTISKKHNKKSHLARIRENSL